MSNTIQRFDPWGYDEMAAYMKPDDLGDYVRYDEHQRITEALRGEIKRLQTELSVKENPNGWKLVPVEPTPEMVSAAEEAHMPFGDMDIALRMAILSAPSAPVQRGDAHKNEAQPEVAQNTGSRSMTNKLSSQGCTGCTGVEGVAAPCETPDAVDIFAWATFDGEGSYDLRLYEDNEGYLDDFRDANPLLHPDWVFPLCRLSDAQRAIAELRGLVPELPPRPPECEGMPR